MSRASEGSAVAVMAQLPDPAEGPARVFFMDNVRYLMVVLVVLYHSVAAYALVAPHWAIHDSPLVAADIVRELLDVFIMPVLFFTAGYFALPSLKKRGPWRFVVDKSKRLLVPWALAVFVVLPLALYDQPVKPIRPFWRYWLAWVTGFQLRLRPTETAVTVSTQAVYWFISLLFVFFAVLALGYAVIERRRPSSAEAPVAGPRTSAAVALTVFGVLICAVYFASLLLVPDSSWFTLSAFLEFQVTRLPLFAGCFALGVYAQSHEWFSTGRTPGSLAVWTALAAAASVAFLAFGRPMFTPEGATAAHAIGYLLGFAALRSLLLVSVLVVSLYLGARFWNRSGGLDRLLAPASYDIYLVHMFVVVGLQTALLTWVAGPAAAKIGIVFVAGLALSFALAKWLVGRHARAFAVGILALFALCLVIRP